MALLNFNGVDAPEPISYNVSLADIQSQNSGRNDSGVMTMEVIRTNVANISASWSFLTQKELETIIKNISTDEISVKYYYGDYKTATMYKGDRKIEMRANVNNEARWDLSLTLIEY